MLYFDHNSTTPVDTRVADLFSDAVRSQFGNASSIHRAGQRARQALEQARRGIAQSLGVSGSEVIVSSGGTEANNLAIRGLLRPGTHAVTSVIEHPSVLAPFRQWQRDGNPVSFVPVGGRGVVDVDAVARAIRPETILVSLMAANNETGALQPVNEVAKIVRARRSLGQALYFHCDGVQAAGKLPFTEDGVDVSQFDLFTLSSHKIYAPKGAGLLVVRKGVPLQPLLLGGTQERSLRAGTENVPAVLALQAALGLCLPDEQRRITGLRDEFERRLLTVMPSVRINAGGAPRLGNTSNVLFPRLAGEALLIALDIAGMCVSTGSACSSGSVEPSHVLLEMGLTVKEARGCLRFSFGRGNTLDEISQLVSALSQAALGMREKQLV